MTKSLKRTTKLEQILIDLLCFPDQYKPLHIVTKRGLDAGLVTFMSCICSRVPVTVSIFYHLFLRVCFKVIEKMFLQGKHSKKAPAGVT